jgi:hypothetical protein
MPFPITKEVSIGGVLVGVRCDKIVSLDHQTILSCVATLGPVIYEEKMTLPVDNHTYSQEQAQKDFDAHVEKVARLCVGRSVSLNIADSLK